LVCEDVERILGYKFANKNLLLEALTHRQFKDTYNLGECYEKLEVLGDAILDYIANSNLIKYTMFEKYNIPERRRQKYITQEDFLPFDAHQAKSLLTKNEFLAKLVCLFGL
jgi:ribonuclease-3